MLTRHWCSFYKDSNRVQSALNTLSCSSCGLSMQRFPTTSPRLSQMPFTLHALFSFLWRAHTNAVVWACPPPSPPPGGRATKGASRSLQCRPCPIIPRIRMTLASSQHVSGPRNKNVPRFRRLAQLLIGRRHRTGTRTGQNRIRGAGRGQISSRALARASFARTRYVFLRHRCADACVPFVFFVCV